MRPPHQKRHTQPTVLHCQPSSLEARWRSWMPYRIWSLRGIRCASPTHESTRPWVSALCVPHSGPTLVPLGGHKPVQEGPSMYGPAPSAAAVSAPTRSHGLVRPLSHRKLHSIGALHQHTRK